MSTYADNDDNITPPGEQTTAMGSPLEDSLLQEVTGILSKVVRESGDTGSEDVNSERSIKSPIELEEEGTRRRTSSWKLLKRMSLGSTGNLDGSQYNDDDDDDDDDDDEQGDGEDGWPSTPYDSAVNQYASHPGHATTTTTTTTTTTSAFDEEPPVYEQYRSAPLPRRPTRSAPAPPPVKSNAGILVSPITPTTTTPHLSSSHTRDGHGDGDVWGQGSSPAVVLVDTSPAAPSVPPSSSAGRGSVSDVSSPLRHGLDAVQRQLELLSGQPLSHGLLIDRTDGHGEGRVLLDVRELEPGVRYQFLSDTVLGDKVSLYRPIGQNGQVIINGSLFTYS